MNSPAQQAFMLEAIRLAIEGVNAGLGGPFGTVVVKEGQIVGSGCNRVTSANDPTAHAEIVAIRDACRSLGVYHLTGCELYTTCEPCPMCLATIYWAHIDRYYYGCNATDASAAGFSDEFVREQLAIPAPQRTIAAQQNFRAESLATFAAWQAKVNRIPY